MRKLFLLLPLLTGCTWLFPPMSESELDIAQAIYEAKCDIWSCEMAAMGADTGDWQIWFKTETHDHPSQDVTWELTVRTFGTDYNCISAALVDLGCTQERPCIPRLVEGWQTLVDLELTRSDGESAVYTVHGDLHRIRSH